MSSSNDMYDSVPVESVKPPITLRKTPSLPPGTVCVQAAGHRRQLLEDLQKQHAIV